MTYSSSGIPPEAYWQENRRLVLGVINTNMLKLETQLVQATPFSDGVLRGGWTLIPATEFNTTALIGQTRSYFFPLEFGRSPGKGISREGQEAVSTWAQRKLGLSSSEASGFAFALSQKYKRVGKAATGFAGLATPGRVPSSTALPDELEPIRGGLIQTAFSEITSDLNRIFQ